jgi:TRAP-type C4-dicarboxylate transport system permease large subunit
MTLVGAILMILGCAMGLTNWLVDAEIPMRLLDWIRAFITSKFAFLLVLNVFLLIIGSLMEIFSALIVIPLILPIALEYDVDLVHLGIIFLTNLEIGFLTPPFGLNLFISSFRFRRSVTEVYHATVPFLVVLAIALLVITYWPDLSLWLPRLYGKGAAALAGN